MGLPFIALLAVAPALAQPPVAPASENPDLAIGKARLAKKDAEGAIQPLQRCLATEPDNIDCHWQLSWAYWLERDWAKVVEEWTWVQRVDPNHPGLDPYLPQAKAQLSLKALEEKGRSSPPPPPEGGRSSRVPAGTQLTVRAVGDMMIGSAFPEGYLPEDDAKDTFTAVADWLRAADLTFGNLEGPLCDGGKTTKCRPDQPPGRCYAFRSPGRYAQIYRAAGFDVVNTANNHNGDFGEACRIETEQHLEEVGIQHSGRPGDIAEMTVKGLKVALIGFHTSPACHDLNDTDGARALVRALAADHDIVIVAFHGGAEGIQAQHVPRGHEFFYGEDRGDLRTFTHAVVDAGADLVLGSGPHVLRGMEIYKDRLIAYSLGNFATYGRFSLGGPLGVGAVLSVTLAADGHFLTGRVLPTRQVGEGRPVKDESGEAIDLVRTLSSEDFPGTAVQVAEDGTLAAE